MKVTTCKGADIQPGQVVKIGGRWYRVVSWFDSEWKGQSGYRFARVMKHDHDPRLTARRTGSLRMVWRDDEYKTREQPAPVWDWVTRELERDAA